MYKTSPMALLNTNDTICALATPPGNAAIAVIRVSGKDTFKTVSPLFRAKKPSFTLLKAETHTLHFGTIEGHEEIIDEVLLSVFRNPHSYTGEDAVEISCHGSGFIVQKILALLIGSGCRMAQPGEFTLRAFLNGKLDLSQAEGVGDLIAANSRASHKLALEQMRGGFSKKISELREQLMQFASLIELELDFSEEDVEFADRTALKDLLQKIRTEVGQLADSFEAGNVIKSGVPVAIIGQPNVGKSTLLNAILNEEKAIVSDIPGTTRDAIEDTIVIKGMAFRFIDTAGLRETAETIESIGIERTYEKIRQAKIILFLFDINQTDCMQVREHMDEFRRQLGEEKMQEKHFIMVANKIDQLVGAPKYLKEMIESDCVFVSAKRKENIYMISDRLMEVISADAGEHDVIVSNARHYAALIAVLKAIASIEEGFREGLPSDLIAVDIRQALHHLGEITGEITNDELLGNIFSRFCIGK